MSLDDSIGSHMASLDTMRLPATPQRRQVVPGRQCVGVVGAKHPQGIGEEFLEHAGRARNIPPCSVHAGQVATGGKCARVVGAHHSSHVGQRLLEEWSRPSCITH
jgi:hypothetical protein